MERYGGAHFCPVTLRIKMSASTSLSASKMSQAVGTTSVMNEGSGSGFASSSFDTGQSTSTLLQEKKVASALIILVRGTFKMADSAAASPTRR